MRINGKLQGGRIGQGDLNYPVDCIVQVKRASSVLSKSSRVINQNYKFRRILADQEHVFPITE